MAVYPPGMSEAELAVLRETEPRSLAGLGEDGLLDLHARVRRARNKHVGQYRRSSAARIEESSARGASHDRGQRARDKAEVFESALARVSAATAKAARASAAELKAARLASARTEPSGPRPTPPEPDPARDQGKRPPVKSTGRVKKDASSRSQGARRQAKRDAR